MEWIILYLAFALFVLVGVIKGYTAAGKSRRALEEIEVLKRTLKVLESKLKLIASKEIKPPGNVKETPVEKTITPAPVEGKLATPALPWPFHSDATKRGEGLPPEGTTLGVDDVTVSSRDDKLIPEGWAPLKGNDPSVDRQIERIRIGAERGIMVDGIWYVPPSEAPTESTQMPPRDSTGDFIPALASSQPPRQNWLMTKLKSLGPKDPNLGLEAII